MLLTRSTMPAPGPLVLLALVLVPFAAWGAKTAPVELAAAARAPIVEELSLNGTLTAPRTARLAVAVAGRVAHLAVDVGDRVAEGDLLVELDDELARLELEQDAAALREAQAELADAQRRLTEARALERSRSFAATEVRSRAAEVARARAVLERRGAARDYDVALVRRHVLKAPFAGVVARRSADLGEWVTPDTPVMTLVSVDRLHLELQVPQRYYARVGPDTPVEVRLEAPGIAPFKARISDVVPVSDPSTRAFLVRAEVDNSAARMTPGMSARAVVRIGTGREGLVVPRDALIRYPDGRTIVWVAEGTGEQRVVTGRRVETGLAFGRQVEVSEGLESGTLVVVRGNEALRESQEVRVSVTR